MKTVQKVRGEGGGKEGKTSCSQVAENDFPHNFKRGGERRNETSKTDMGVDAQVFQACLLPPLSSFFIGK